MPNTFEGDLIDRSEKTKQTIDGLRDTLAWQTPEETDAKLDAGYQLMVDDFNSDSGFFDRQQARMAPTAEEITADQMAADLAYSASRPRPKPSDFRS